MSKIPQPTVWRRGAAICGVLLTVLFAGIASVASAQLTWYDLTPATNPPIANPYKGFMDYADGALPAGSAEFPHTLEFFYIGMDEFWVEDGVNGWQIDFAALELELDAIAGRGRQAVFRIYVDYPRERLACPGSPPTATFADTALPNFLMDGLGGDDVALTYYCDAVADLEGWSPETTDADFIKAVEELLADLVAAYDGDPRIGYVQVGLLGHWGEWHTFFDPEDPLECGAVDIDVPEDHDEAAVHAVMNDVLAAFDAFDTTFTLVSADILQCAQRPVDGSASDPGVAWFDFAIGLHDDDFANSTVCETYGMVARSATWSVENDWVALPVGGEVQPSLQGPIHDDDDTADCGTDPDVYDTGELDGAVDATHPTFLLNYDLFHSSVIDPQLANAESTNRRMGYEYFVPSVALPDVVETGDPLQLTVRVENHGTAPVYYALDVELVVLDGASEVAIFPTNIFLEDVYDAPTRGTDALDFDIEIADHGLAHGTYDLALRVPNPMVGGRALHFANEEQLGDLLMLGSVMIDEGLIFADGFELGNTTAWN